jgi:hypothetical protein
VFFGGDDTLVAHFAHLAQAEVGSSQGQGGGEGCHQKGWGTLVVGFAPVGTCVQGLWLTRGQEGRQARRVAGRQAGQNLVVVYLGF